MPTFVDPSKCDGCKGGEKTACMYICPNDLMILDPQEMKAYNQEPDACWECYSCVKICPQGAITARPYADLYPHALCRLHHVDRAVPQRQRETFQVPHPYHS